MSRHRLMLRAIAKSKKRNDRLDASKITDCRRCNFLPECYMGYKSVSETLLREAGQSGFQVVLDYGDRYDEAIAETRLRAQQPIRFGNDFEIGSRTRYTLTPWSKGR